jgi:multiple sugar transport system substrate-binding protein
MKGTTMRKRAIVALVAAGSALSLAACSGGQQSAQSEESGSGGVTITYSNFISNGGNEENLQTIVDAFEKENPGITVDVQTTDYANYFTQLQTDLSAGTQADVFDVDAGSFPNLQADGVLAALDGVDASAYRDSVLQTYQVDGAQYGLPTSFSTVLLFYNKDLFDAAGIAYPDDTWTWKDEQAAAEKLTDTANGVWGDYQPISYNEYYKALAQTGGSFLSADGSAAAFGDAAGVRAAQWLTAKSATTMPTAEDGAGTPDFDLDLFKAGKLAMWHTGNWMISLVGDLPFDWDIAVEPGDTQEASAVFSNAVAVSAQSQHAEAAQKFATFLSSSSVMVSTRLDAGWELPATSDESALSPYLEAGTPANRQAVFDSLDSIVSSPVLGPNSQEIQDDVTNALTEIAAGRSDASTAMPTLADDVSALLK